MTKSTSNSLKGIFAILVLLCHDCGQSGFCMVHGIGAIITAFGYWVVSIFLFLSGYGLMKQYTRVGGGYLIDFQKNRIASIYVLNVILIFLYTCEKLLFGIDISIKELIQSFLFGGTVVRNGWYLQMIVLMYCLFFISFKYIKSIKWKMFSVFVGTILYCIMCILLGLGSTWYECMLCFPLGLLVSKEESRIDCFLERKYWMTLLGVSALFVGSFLISIIGLIAQISIPFKILSSMAFVLMVYLFVKKIPVQLKVTNFLGGYYMEIYVLQGLVLILLKQYSEHLTPFVHFSLAIIGTLLIAILMKKPLKWVMGVVKRK